MSVRTRRIESEWILLRDLEACNVNVLTIAGKEATPLQVSFRIVLGETNALVRSSETVAVRSSHVVRVCFPRFFPSVPSEIYLEAPVFHPNVDPENGFVCLWSKISIDNHIVKTLQILQAVISWHAFNWKPDHLIQPAAKIWYESKRDVHSIPLEYRSLQVPPSVFDLAKPLSPRRRLSECE
jgi:hypothetical protein